MDLSTRSEKSPDSTEQDSRHGSAPHPDLENGPLEDRNCTDIFFCILFIFGLIGMLVIGAIGFKQGQPIRLTYPYDPNDRACGYDDQVKDYPFIYFATPFPGFYNRTVCVAACPNYQNDSNKPSSLKCVTNQQVLSCDERSFPEAYDLSNTSFGYNTLMNNTVFIYNTTALLGRLCLPNGEPQASKAASKLNVQIIQKWVSDLQYSWGVILASIGVAYFFGFIYMIIMRYFSGCMTWISIMLYFIIVVGLGFLSYIRSLTQSQYGEDFNLSDSEKEYINNPKFPLTLAIIFWSIAGISLLIFICYFTRIKLAIAIVKTSALFIKDVPTAQFVPIVFGIIVITFWALWIAMFVFVFSMGQIKTSGGHAFAVITWDQTTKYMLLFQIFEAFWCSALIHALCEFILASSCAIWYFTPAGQEQSLVVTKSVSRAFLYHLGSLAFGSLILALVQFLRFWLEYMHQQMKAQGVDQQQPMKTLMDCMRCYSEYFQRFIQFLNKNAYIQIAISGKGFCAAAKDAFWLIFSNPGTFSIVEGVGHVFLDVGKYFIALATSLTAHYVVTEYGYYKGKLYQPLVPVIFIFIISAMIGHVFMVVYGMGIDTILQCYCLDEELQKQKGSRAKFCQPLLRDFLDQHIIKQ